MRMMIALLVGLLFSMTVEAKPLAFPGAQGFGAYSVGGRGGAVVRVTNLNDSGPGSLRAAIDRAGPRTVIFDLSGTIVLKNYLTIRNPFITIAGQTAPSPGITLRGAGLSIAAPNVIVQHLRIRVGDGDVGPDKSNRDGFQILGPNSKNVILDHLSVSWGVDENGSAWYGGAENITVSNSIISEGLRNAGHPKGAHSMGMLLGNKTRNISIIGSLLAHHNERHPRIREDATAVLVNNVFYDARGVQCVVGNQDLTAPAPVTLTIRSNVFLAGPSTTGTKTAVHLLGGVWVTGSKVYVEGNLAPGHTMFRGAPTARVSTPPIWSSTIVVRDVTTVETRIKANAGARPRNRDAVDRRIISELGARAGRIIDSQSEVGGWPALAVNRRTLTLPSNPGGDSDGDGYTNLEELLHTLSAALEL